jgi:acetyl esterase/lipase
VTLTSPSARPAAEIGPPPPFDPECAAALEQFAEAFSAPLTAELIPALRQAELTPRPTDDDLRRGGAFTVEERSAPGPEGAPDVSLLICRPTAATGPTPAIFYTHGGGMIIGDNRAGVLGAVEHAEELGMAVVSVEYRLAPETPHPGPVEDCYAGLVWTAQHADELGVDGDRIVLIGGSAGGGIAAAVALLARDRHGPAPAGQLLMCPMLDDRNDSPSVHQMAEGPMWSRSDNEIGWTALLGDARGGPDVSPYAAPARADDLSGLPPAFIDIGSADTFRDEDVAYATRIWQAGGIAELHVWPGGYHGFDGIVPHAALSKAAVAARANWLARLVGDAGN